MKRLSHAREKGKRGGGGGQRRGERRGLLLPFLSFQFSLLSHLRLAFMGFKNGPFDKCWEGGWRIFCLHVFPPLHRACRNFLKSIGIFFIGIYTVQKIFSSLFALCDYFLITPPPPPLLPPPPQQFSNGPSLIFLC